MKTAITDTGFVLSVAIPTDKWHTTCLSLYRQHHTIYLPQSTLAEIAYLLTREGGNQAVVRFLENLPSSKYRVIALEQADIQRTTKLLRQYADARIDFVDVTVAVIAERLRIQRILTLDQRDFRLLRPQTWGSFELLPEIVG